MKRPKKRFLRNNRFYDCWHNNYFNNLLVFLYFIIIQTRSLTWYCAGFLVFGLPLCVITPSHGLESQLMKGPQNGIVKTERTKTDKDLFSPLQHVMLGGVRFFQKWISPIDGSRCNFSPTCSRYGYEAIHNHGSFLGIIITADRLLRCSYLTENGSAYNRLPNGTLHDPVANNLLTHP